MEKKTRNRGDGNNGGMVVRAEGRSTEPQGIDEIHIQTWKL